MASTQQESDDDLPRGRRKKGNQGANRKNRSSSNNGNSRGSRKAGMPGHDTGNGAGSYRGHQIELVSLDRIATPEPDPGDAEMHAHAETFGTALAANQGRIEHPLILRSCPAGTGQLLVVAGRLRYLGARAAGLTQVPAIIRDLSAAEAKVVALVENMARRRGRPSLLRMGWHAAEIIAETGCLQKTLAKRLWCSESSISEAIRFAEIIPRARAVSLADMFGISPAKIGTLGRSAFRGLNHLESDAERDAAVLAMCARLAESPPNGSIKPGVQRARIECSAGEWTMTLTGERAGIVVPCLRTIGWRGVARLMLALIRAAMTARRSSPPSHSGQ